MAFATPHDASAQQNGSREFSRLPSAIQNHVRKIRASCRELDPKHRVYHAMTGISEIDLEGDGVKELMVDNLGLCNSHMAGANCSNRGCDLLIWKRSGKRWRKVFEEHLFSKFLSIDPDTSRFKLMAATIYAGDARCKPDPNRNYTSGMACDVLVRYRNGRWVWEKIE